MTIPSRSSALNHEDPWPALSRRGSVTTVSVSGGSLPQNASIAAAPSAPGLPAARRSSISFLSPKSERLAPLAASSPQSKPRSGARTTRSENPLARARADRVRSLERKQRLVAVDRVQRLQLARKVGIELLEPESGHAIRWGPSPASLRPDAV